MRAHRCHAMREVEQTSRKMEEPKRCDVA